MTVNADVSQALLTAKTLHDALRTRLSYGPDEPLTRCGNEWFTVADMDRVSESLAGGLHELGVGKGDRVGVFLPSRQEIIELFFACAKLGAILVPYNPYLRGEFLAYQLVDSGAKVLVTDEPGAAAATTVLDRCEVTHLLLTQGAPPPSCPVLVLRYSDVAASDSAAPSVHIEPGDLITIMYTSGTTGPSKGCMMSHGYYLSMTDPWVDAGWVVPGDRVYTGFTLFHTGGHLMLMFALTLPGTSTSYETEFSASRFLTRAAADECTMLFGVGSMAMAILAQPVTAEDGEHPFRLACFPPMPPDAQEEFEHRFGTPVIAEGIGQTECTLITIDSVHEERRRGGNGKPWNKLDVRLVDDNDQEVANGEVGELVYRPRIPHAMFSGYWGKPEATLSAWTNLWHHSGDYFKVDQDGFYHFLDRKKDALRRRGENVSSFELETAISGHPGVERVAVCAVPSSLGGDDIKACIVPAPGVELAAEELFEFFKLYLPYFAIPRYVQLRKSLPTTAATDRVQKHILRAEGVTADTWDFEQLQLVISKSDRR